MPFRQCWDYLKGEPWLIRWATILTVLLGTCGLAVDLYLILLEMFDK